MQRFYIGGGANGLMLMPTAYAFLMFSQDILNRNTFTFEWFTQWNRWPSAAGAAVGLYLVAMPGMDLALTDNPDPTKLSLALTYYHENGAAGGAATLAMAAAGPGGGFTAQLGIGASELGNIELGAGAGVLTVPRQPGTWDHWVLQRDETDGWFGVARAGVWLATGTDTGRPTYRRWQRLYMFHAGAPWAQPSVPAGTGALGLTMPPPVITTANQGDIGLCKLRFRVDPVYPRVSFTPPVADFTDTVSPALFVIPCTQLGATKQFSNIYQLVNALPPIESGVAPVGPPTGVLYDAVGVAAPF